ncbi:hypothetical protein DL767_010186 [Monosporascus sp. MG133]|nr:hypothetical protein DL767_010186 [Monosporascus sp. MG133]
MLVQPAFDVGLCPGPSGGGNSSTSRKGPPAVSDVLDAEQELAQSATSWLPIFIDVGGVSGFQCIFFRQRYPALAGRVVLQYQLQVAGMVKGNPLPSFENIQMEAPRLLQVRLRTRAHYLRNVLHNYPEAEVVKILTTIKTGMTEESVVLVDEAGPATRAVRKYTEEYEDTMISVALE